jgi:hypothetical protein
MLDMQRIVGARPLPGWATAVLGALAGLLAVGLLTALSPLWAALALGALVAGVLAIGAPQAALYALAGAMIAQWPGRLITVAGAGMAGLALLWALAARRSLMPRDGLFAILGLLAGLVWLSALALGAQESARVALTFSSFLALYWMVSTLCTGAAFARRFAYAMQIAGVLTALIGFVQFVHPFVWIASAQYFEADSALNAGASLGLLDWEGFARIESVTGTPNYLGLSMQILLPLAVFWMYRRTTALGRIAGVAAIGALAAALVLSFTRGVMLTTAAITLPLLVIKLGWRRTLPYVAILAAAAAIVVVAWAPLRARVISTLVEVLSADPGTAAGWRVAATPIGIQMFLDHFWTGVGIGQQRSLWVHYAPTYIFTPGAETQLPIHNGYLAIAIDLGIGGLALLLLLMALAWRRLRRLQDYFRATGQRQMLDLAAASEVALLSYIASIAMYPGVENFRYFWVLLALIGALSRVWADQRSRLHTGALAARGIGDRG